MTGASEPQELLDRVVHHMMEENKEEIGKAMMHYFNFGTFCLEYGGEGWVKVKAINPLDIVKMGEEE